MVFEGIGREGKDAFEKVFAAVTAASIEYGTNLRDHLSPAIIKAAEAMGLLGERTAEVEKNTKGLSTTAVQLGHYINELGKEVNAYGNDIAKLTDDTQRLLDLQIRVKTPFATEIDGLQKQLQQANADLLALGRRIPELGYEGYKQQQKVLLDLIAELNRRIAALKATATSTTPGGTTTTTTTTSPTSTTTTRPAGDTRPFSGGRQHGGPVSAGASYLVGERGPELFVPRQRGTVLPAGQTGTPPHTTVYQIIVHTQAQDASQLVRDLVPLLRQADLSRRTMGG